MRKIIRKLVMLISIPRKAYQLLRDNNAAMAELFKVQDIQYRDILDLVTRSKKLNFNTVVYLKTEYPIAYESKDHLEPFGTMQDNTRCLGFYTRCYTLYNENLSYLDLGCSGGGLVFEFSLNGHLAIGLEGSDYSMANKRANWRTIPDNLFTCDITKPYDILSNENDGIYRFKVISCWEVLEHIDEYDLGCYFENVVKHLDVDGIFIGSISKVASDPLHVTVRENSWWESIFSKYGLSMVEDSKNPFKHTEFARGVGGGMYDTCDYNLNPENGFHFVAKHS